MTVINAGFDQ